MASPSQFIFYVARSEIWTGTLLHFPALYFLALLYLYDSLHDAHTHNAHTSTFDLGARRTDEETHRHGS